MSLHSSRTTLSCSLLGTWYGERYQSAAGTRAQLLSGQLNERSSNSLGPRKTSQSEDPSLVRPRLLEGS